MYVYVCVDPAGRALKKGFYPTNLVEFSHLTKTLKKNLDFIMIILTSLAEDLTRRITEEIGNHTTE